MSDRSTISTRPAAAGNQLGVRTRLTSQDRPAASVWASRIVFIASLAACGAVAVEAWVR